jgi:hypothetical protein
MDDDLQSEYNDLLAAKEMIESETFQRFFAGPIKKERDALRTAFFSDSLKESWRKGGRQEGLNVFIDILKQIPNELKNKKNEMEDSRRGA